MKHRYILFLFFLFIFSVALGQNKIRVYGYVIDTDNRGVEFVNVYFEGTSHGTSTNVNGYYSLMAEIGDSVKIVYSMVGYETVEYTIYPTKPVFPISVELKASTQMIKDFDVVAHRMQTSTVETLNVSNHRIAESAAGGIEGILLIAGVPTSGISSQYTVRGGNFDENSVYVNGIEVYRPLLIKQGQQEGLSFVNPDMVANVDFSTGGFAAQYGDKMSSVLDITYKKPKKFESTVSLSLLGASAYVGTAGKKFTQMHGLRYKTSAYMLGTLDTQGEYKPNFFDYQTYLTYDFTPKWELTFLGNFSQNTYNFIPEKGETTFGTYNMARKVEIFFDGQEKDLFRTAFGALSLNYRPTEKMKLGLLTSVYHTNEHETYDITAEYLLTEQKMELDPDDKTGETLGIGIYHEHARNRLKATVANISHQGEYELNDNHRFKWGATAQKEIIDDKLNEWEWRDSVGYSLPHTSEKLDVYYNMKSDNSMSSGRFMAFFQDTYRWDANIGRFSVTGGLRANYWTFNEELIVSPRASISLIPAWEKRFSFRFATGLYYQSPFYKEMRDTIVDPSGNVKVHLNEDIKSQRSVHFVLGGDHYFRAWGRPFKFTTEAYLKLADNVITYSVDNVNVSYSGKNDAETYTAGIDFKLFGELVPGTDSWINFSLMQSRERFTKDTYNLGWTPRPNESRYAFSMLFQDYLPNNPKYKMHLKFIWSDGLPFGVPRSIRQRVVGRAPDYKRVDIGISRVLASGSDKFMSRPFFRHIDNIWLNFEIFNLLDFRNVNSYYWISDVHAQEYAVPNYLTRRQFNFKIIVDFK